MKIVLVYEDIFSLSCPRGVRQEFRDLRVLKIDSLSPDTLISPSSFMTCPSSQGSIAQNVKFMYIIYGIFWLYKSQNAFSNPRPQGLKEEQNVLKNKDIFIYESFTWPRA